MARIEQDQIEKIESFPGVLSGITHVMVYFTPDVDLGDKEWTILPNVLCSCAFNKVKDENNVSNS